MDAEIEQQLKEKLEELKEAATPRNVSRMVIKAIARSSVGFAAAALAKTYVPTESKKQELQVTVGAYVIGGMAADAAGEWAAREFDERVDFILQLFGKKPESEENTDELAEETEPTESID